MADHHWPTPTEATSLAQGKVLGVCDGRSTSEIIVTMAGDGISVIHMETLEILQSWAFQEEEGCEPTGPACFQKSGGIFCVPMMVPNANRSSSRRKQNQIFSFFLYVWKMGDIESKSIRHVSTKVELSSSARYILPIVCNSGKFSGSQDCIKRYSKGFFVITDDGVASILDTETSRLEPIELPKTGSIVSAACHENGVTLAYTESQGKRKNNVLFVSRLWFGQYPSLLESKAWKLDIEDEANLLQVTCSMQKVVVVLSNGSIFVYDIPHNSNSDSLSPLFSRRLRMDSASGQQKGKKRGIAGASGLDEDLRVFIDSFSRAFICRHDDKSLLRIVTIDLLYGGVLWVGCVERNGPSELVTKVIMCGEETVDVCLALGGSRVIRIAADIPKVSLASLVGSMRIQNTVKGNDLAKLNPLALNARLVLNSDSLAEMNESTRLGKVKIGVTPRKGFEWLQPASSVVWEPSVDEGFARHEKKLASMVRTKKVGGDSKSKSEFLKELTLGLNMCKTSDVSFTSEISAGILTTLIDLKQWDSIGSLLMYSHPQTLSHCPGSAASLAQNARYVELFALLRNVSDLSPQELYSVIKSMIGASGPEYEVTSEGLMSSLSSHADQQIRKAETYKEIHGDIQIDSDVITAARLAAAPIHGFSQKQLVCHPLLGLHPDPALLCAAMKRLHSHSLIYLIHYLGRWFNNIIELDVIRGGESPTCELAHVPSLNTVITWLAAAVDAGNLRLSTTEKGIKVLKKLSEDLQLHMKGLESLGALSGILEHLEKARQRKTPQRSGADGVFTSQCFSL